MADYRNDDDRTLPGAPGMNRTPETDPEHLIPEHTHAAAPGTIGAQLTSDDPDVVRSEIERTRQRMSGTIDEIESVLLRKKGEIQERLDVTAPVRERPWAFAGGVFGTGLLLGFLTGGGKGNGAEEDHEYVKVPRALLEGVGLEESGGAGLPARGGSGEWEARTRELMQVVARQEEEIRDLRAVVYGDRDWDVDALGEAEMAQPESLGAVDVEEEWDEDWNFSDEDDDFETIEALGYDGEADEGGLHVGKPLAGLIAAGVAGVVAGAARKLLAGRGGGAEMDVQVELEPSGGASIVDDRADRYDGLADARDAMATPRQPAQAPRYGGHTPPHGIEEGERDYPYTNRPPSYGRPVEVEVELEQPQRGYARPAPRRGVSLPSMPEMSPLAGAVAVGAAVAISGLVARVLHARSHREEMDVEVELENRSGYRPSVQPQGAYTPQRAAQAGGEMQVEVELEGQGRQQPRAYTESPSYPHAAQQGQGGEVQVEVDLENRGGTSQFGGSTEGIDRRPQSPPLM
jgi:hypothetical protein